VAGAARTPSRIREGVLEGMRATTMTASDLAGQQGMFIGYRPRGGRHAGPWLNSRLLYPLAPSGPSMPQPGCSTVTRPDLRAETERPVTLWAGWRCFQHKPPRLLAGGKRGLECE
jgi:hypothetical protein